MYVQNVNTYITRYYRYGFVYAYRNIALTMSLQRAYFLKICLLHYDIYIRARTATTVPALAMTTAPINADATLVVRLRQF